MAHGYKMTSAKTDMAEWLCLYAHKTSANPVIELPNPDTLWA